MQTCVTSPPYWGLRDYGTARWEGGAEGCDHVQTEQLRRDKSNGVFLATRGTQSQTAQTRQYRDTCGKCGARRIDAQIGLEATPEEFTRNLVEVFALVREVLADDGTLWLNLGDSYATSGVAGPQRDVSGGLGGGRDLGTRGRQGSAVSSSGIERFTPPGLKPKDLCGIPWRVAFALQADGWYLRSDIIWHKPNPMPESVTDRPTKSHEYLFLLSKKARYFYDADAIKEPAIDAGKFVKTNGGDGLGDFGRTRDGFRRGVTVGEFRNRRTVWTITPKPFKGAHFATFPPKLVEPCVLAGSRPGDLVLDPFFGAGTTGMVAEQLGRRYVGIELNSAYSALAREAA